ncbi:MAG: hypothetical protein JXI33_05115 [Candidatus Aminicenantes bacterium]|nr:hypothetical protein [Candidatus Aminicenantes bacterium]
MVLDYKDVAFSFQKRKIRRRRQRLKLALLILALGAIFCGYRYLRVSAASAKIQNLLLSGRVSEAEKKINASASAFFLRAQFRELRALSDLFGDRLPQAQTRFDELNRLRTKTSLHSGRFQKYFLDHGEYHKLKIYTDYLLPQGGDENIWFDALVHSAFFNAAESEKAVARLSAAFRQSHAKALAILAKVNADLRQGRFEYIFDKNGSALAYFDVRKQKTYSLLPGLDLSDFDRQLKKGLSYFQLTLDSTLQKKIDRLFKDFFGTLVVLNLPQNRILAAYSKPRSPGVANAVFSEAYEPGSIVKIISLLAYLRQDNQSLFPFDCPGHMALGGKIFYDWTAHQHVKDYSSALAMSCNLSFAKMGLQVGSKRLAAMLELFHFNSRPFQDWFLTFRTGTFNRELNHDFALAKLAVGIGEISLTTIHAAMLAAVFSQNGLLFPPYLIEDAKSVLYLGYYSHDSREQRLLSDDINFRRVKKAMQATVNDEKGTSHQARSASADLAVKTGTAGDRRYGFDALVIGFFPARNPRYAFAFRLEGAGKPELTGVLFLRDLVNILQKK